jgi:hypothetical protein
MACYQRSGSTLLRKYLENLTRIYTGSDGDVKTHLDKQLFKIGLAGESILGNKVWIAQTNFPEETGIARTFVNKCVLVVRNPMDSIYSFFNMMVTNSLDKKLDEEDMERLHECWDEFLRQEITIWRKFHEYWMLEPLISTYIVRHEDLVENPRSTLTGLFKFLLNTDSISDTLIESLITDETEKEVTKDRYKQNQPGYSFTRYTEDQQNFIKIQSGRLLRRMGYLTGFENPKNPIAQTEFFERDDNYEKAEKYEIDSIVRNTTETKIKMRYDYLDLNKFALKKVASDKHAADLLTGDLPELEINLEIENIRTRSIT